MVKFLDIERASGRWIYDVYVFIVRSTRYKRLANVEYEWAVNELGDGMSEQSKEVFFEALLVAASRCSLLVDSLART